MISLTTVALMRLSFDARSMEFSWRPPRRSLFVAKATMKTCLSQCRATDGNGILLTC